MTHAEAVASLTELIEWAEAQLDDLRTSRDPPASEVEFIVNARAALAQFTKVAE